jgi:hypothetical protein
MNWSKVGDFISDNAGTGASILGALLTGGTSAAISSAISIVAGVTGTTDPDKAIKALQANPDLLLELEKAKLNRATEIDKHVLDMAKVSSGEHEQTQLTVRNGDNAEGNIKWVRPSHATVSLIVAIFYTFTADKIDWMILSAWLTLPFTYAGLREFGKHSLNKNK